MFKFTVLLIGLLATSIICSNYEETLFPSLPGSINHTQNELCKNESKIFEIHLKNLTLWAYEMMDASSKSPYSILQGSNTHFGNWEECLNTNGPFLTQYCLVTLKANVAFNSKRNPISLYYGPFESVLEKFRKSDDASKRSRNVVNLGVCLPASCSPSDIKESYDYYLKNIENSMTKRNVTYHVTIDSKMCQTKNVIKKMDSWDILFGALCVVLLLIVIFSTMYDFYNISNLVKLNDRKRSKLETLYLAFSARKNTMDLFAINNINSELKVLHGIKFFSLLVVVFGHRFMVSVTEPLINLDYIERLIRFPLSSLIFNATLFVNTFFTMSGFLLSYMWLNKTNTMKPNSFYIVSMRYARLTPLYAFIVFYGATLYYFSGSGPLWNGLIAKETEDCRKNWWKNLLYISNYVDSENVCMRVTWYVCCDLHLFILGIFIMTVLTKNQCCGYLMILILLIISFSLPFGQILYYNSKPLIEFFPEVMDQLNHDEFINLIYIKSHNRALVYIIGIAGGICYSKLQNKFNPLTKTKFYCITAGLLAIIFSCLVSGAAFYNRNWKIDVFISAIYFPLVNAFWSLATVGIFLSAIFGSHNIIISVLSCRIFAPFTKLAYGIYLVHMPIMWIRLSKLDTIRRFSVEEMIYAAIADVVLAILTAFVLYITIEAPAKKLLSEVLRKANKPNQNNISL